MQGCPIPSHPTCPSSESDLALDIEVAIPPRRIVPHRIKRPHPHLIRLRRHRHRTQIKHIRPARRHRTRSIQRRHKRHPDQPATTNRPTTNGITIKHLHDTPTTPQHHPTPCPQPTPDQQPSTNSPETTPTPTAPSHHPHAVKLRYDIRRRVPRRIKRHAPSPNTAATPDEGGSNTYDQPDRHRTRHIQRRHKRHPTRLPRRTIPPQHQYHGQTPQPHPRQHPTSSDAEPTTDTGPATDDQFAGDTTNTDGANHITRHRRRSCDTTYGTGSPPRQTHRTVTQYGCDAGTEADQTHTTSPTDTAPGTSNDPQTTRRPACHAEPSHHNTVSRSNTSTPPPSTPNIIRRRALHRHRTSNPRPIRRRQHQHRRRRHILRRRTRRTVVVHTRRPIRRIGVIPLRVNDLKRRTITIRCLRPTKQTVIVIRVVVDRQPKRIHKTDLLTTIRQLIGYSPATVTPVPYRTSNACLFDTTTTYSPGPKTTPAPHPPQRRCPP